MKKKYTTMLEPATGIIHINHPTACGGEFTLCGVAYDEPASERGEPAMVDCDLPANCPECLRDARVLLPILRHELRRAEGGKHA